MKTGQIIKSPRYRWYEPQHALLGGHDYFTHAWGTAYVLSGAAAAALAAVRGGTLRHFANEGEGAGRGCGGWGGGRGGRQAGAMERQGPPPPTRAHARTH